MFLPQKGGSTEKIYDYYVCQIPPVGFGVNVVTGLLEKTDIIKRSTVAKDQYWERTPLPANWKKQRLKEELRQQKEPDYFDEELEKFREQEWGRRLRGVWVYINGKPVYLTGLHYFYINWWKIDIGYPEYRTPDRKFFYVLSYCLEDDRCGGLVEATKRRQGKTYRGGCFLYESISRMSESEGGIQSKTATDARDVVFKKAIISPFKNLPDFFRPIFDTSKGITPTSELKFAHTVSKGRNALMNLDVPELNSVIDWASSEVFAYDGRKKKRIFEDEIGKTKDVNIYDRHQVIRYCLETDGAWTGFALKSTTVEDMDNGGKPFRKLWDDSNPNERDENGHTKTGMYRYMTPAYETLYFNKYGDPDVQKGKQYFLNRRAAFANDSRSLSSEIRKNPFNEMEMFRIDGDTCLYDSEKLNNQLDRLTWGDNFTTYGDLVWKDGIKDTEVIWKPNKKGAFEISYLPKPELTNRVIKRGDLYFPNNKLNFIAGGDPYDYDQTKDTKRSNGTGFVKFKYSTLHSNLVHNDSLIVRYSNRPPMANIYYEDMIRMCHYFGCEFLAERNKIGLIRYFQQRGYGNFLICLPGEKEPGVYASPKTHQEMIEITEEFIMNNIEKVFFKSLIEQWLKFDPKNTERFDEAMGAGWCLVADRYRIVKAEIGDAKPIENYFKQFKIPA